MKKIDFIVLSILLLFIIIFFFNFFYPTLKIFITPDFGGSDIFRYSLPDKFFLSSMLKNNMLPLWNKDIATGFPLTAEGPIGTFNLINIILFKFLPFPFSYNLGYVISFIISAIGTYFYSRFLKLNRLVSLFVSFIFTFSGLFAVHFSHYNYIQAASLLPIIFLISSIYLKNNRKIILLVLALLISQQLFFGFTQITVYTVICIILFAFYGLLKKKIVIGAVFGLIIGVAISILISSVQILPSKELLSLSSRKNGISLKEATYFSYSPKHFLTMLNPFYLGNPRKGTYPIFSKNDGNIFWENTGYIGIIPLILAMISFFKIKNDTNIQFYWLLLVFSALLMLGKYSPLYFIFSFPPFSFFRVPSRFILFFVWALTILSGFGFHWLTQYIQKKLSVILIIVITLIIIGFSFYQLFNFSYNYNPTGNAFQWLEPPETISFLKQNKGRYFTLGTGYWWNKYFFTKGWEDTQPYYHFRNDLRPNFNTLFNVPSNQQLDALITKRYGLLLDLIGDGIKPENDKFLYNDYSLKLLAMSNVSYLLSPVEIANLDKVYETKNNPSEFPSYKIYAIPAVLPRAHMIYTYKTVDTVEEMQQALLSETFDPKKEVILEKKIDFAKNDESVNKTDATSEIEWLDDQEQKLSLQVKTGENGLLVLADSYYPGWKAFVDDKETEILSANLNQRGIVLNKGNHKVSFVYNPKSFKIGLTISLISYLFISYLILYPFVSSYLRKRRNIS